jgi:type I restriction enzyme, S subunit
MSVLPDGWICAKLEDVCASITDGDHLPPPQVENGVPFLVIGDVRTGTISFEGSRRVPEDYFAGLSDSRKPRRGDLLYTVTGSFGIPVLVGTDQPFCVQRHIAILRPAPETDVRYLRHALATSTSFAQAAAIATGTAQKTVPLRGLRRLTIPLAPSQQQQEIVAAIESHFSRLDAATATLERVQRNLERYRASVLKAAVEGRLVPTEAELAKKEGRSYEPASVLLKRILAERRRRWEEAELAKLKAKGKPPTDDRWTARYEEPAALDTDGLPELPEGWCWTTLEAIAEVKGGLAKGKHRRSDEKLTAVPYLRVANVQRGHLDLSEVKTIETTESELADLALRNGDVLFNEGGDRDKLGRGWIWRSELPVCIHQNHVFRARLIAPQVLPEFVSWHGNSNGQRYFFDEGKHTTNLASLSLSKLRSLPVPLPPTAEQVRIKAEVERLLSLACEAEAFSRTSQHRTSRLRQSILKWAFEGRLVHGSPPPSSH